MIEVFPSEGAVAEGAAMIFLDKYKSAVGRGEKFSVVLAGGNTPRLCYELLAKLAIDWSKVAIFFGDERYVSPSDSRSNFGMASRIFLSQVPIPSSQVFPIPYGRSAEESAAAYEAVLRSYFAGTDPCFHLVFLGLGEDGHTASLFPGASALRETKRWVIATKKNTEDFARITLSASILSDTELALFLVTGSGKRNILARVVSQSESLLPANLIQPGHGEVLFLADKLACYPCHGAYVSVRHSFIA